MYLSYKILNQSSFDFRTLSIGITQSAMLASGCSSVKVFPELKGLIGLPGLCTIYSIAGIVAMIWGALTIPDNRGKSLVKVEESLEKKSGNDPAPVKV